MAKRKFSFLADEDEKYEQEYQKELAEEQKLAKKEADIKLTNKGKQGVSMISGDASPTVGEKNTYNILHWYEETPLEDRNPAKVTWELFKKRRDGKFTTTNIKKTGISSFTFGEVASQHTYRLEAYLHKPEGGGLIITPKSSKIPKIGKVELHYVDNKKGDTFSFYDTLRAKAHTTHLAGKEVIFTLWEDDAKDSGHDPKNLIVEAKTVRVGSDGLAIAEFQLTKALMKKAMKGEADAKELEFYITVEYYKGNIHDSENVNVKNPLYWTPGVVPPPLGTKKPERKATVKAKNSPAEQKPISKREEKNILIPQSKDYLQHDWAEVMGKALKNKERTVFKDYGNSTVGVKAPKKEEKKEKCVCQQYDLIWGNKVSCEFRKKVVEICAKLWGESRKMEMANELMTCMALETGKKFTSDVGYPNATGLVQFTSGEYGAITAMNENGYNNGEKITKEILKNLSPVKQLDYVKLYFEMWMVKYKKNIRDSLDMYMTIWCPSAVGREDTFVCYSAERDKRSGKKFYEKNKSAEYEYYDENEKIITARLKKDANKANGEITKGELRPRLKYWKELGKNNKSTSFICIDNKNNTDNDKIESSGYYIFRTGEIKYIEANSIIDYYVQVKEGNNVFKKISTLNKNTNGLVKFPDSGKGFNRYGGVDKGGISKVENVGEGDHYLKPETAAALFGIINEINDKNWEVHFGDMSSSNGSDPWQKGSKHHAGHGHLGVQSGRNIDFRYLNKTGVSFHGVNTSNNFDKGKNETFYTLAFKYGFQKNYASGMTDFRKYGVNPNVGGHYDHGHIGLNNIKLEKVKTINVKILK
ncbi:hypothetical protein [Chryseobacterium sp. JUb7]|uniref:hypothetical protein n=1 Tax=Chryseobacterium sp. JUb7 TaxID=2940599 RepID=UPI00216A463B|nr:hypothetical protein [Chryseobacterium sp. JUb7]MCS3532585.1 hypothetical protein [Chryseobacterium sp. JUb7]